MVYKLRTDPPYRPRVTEPRSGSSSPFCLAIIDICLGQNGLLYLFIVNYKARARARTHTVVRRDNTERKEVI